MDSDETNDRNLNVANEEVIKADMKSEKKSGNETEFHERVGLLNAYIEAVSGKGNVSEMPKNEPSDLVDQMREIMFKTFDENEKNNDGKTHLQLLAEKQGKQLIELPKIGPESTAEEELNYINVLVKNINAVQGGGTDQYGQPLIDYPSSLGITPNMSQELNCMDCSMSTWTMIHEAKKVGINIEFGSPIGHAIGIVTAKDGRVFYADGQNGFVEKIDTAVEFLPNGGKIIEIVNWNDIQARQNEHNGVKDFFPQHVFVDSRGGVSATLSNLHSMLYVQYTDDITDVIRQKYDPREIKLVETLKPYAKKYKADTESINDKEFESLHPDSDRPYSRMKDINDILSPDLYIFRESPQYLKDQQRLDGTD